MFTGQNQLPSNAPVTVVCIDRILNGLPVGTFYNAYQDVYKRQSYISRFERGLVDNPTRATLEHLADTLGITLEELIRSENTDDSSRLESPKEKLGLNNPDFLKRYSDLSGAQQHRVYRIVGLLLGLNEP